MNTPRSQFFACPIIVSDLERSTRFYRDALGFVEGATRSPNEGKVGFVGRFMKKDALVIELLEFERPVVIDGNVQMTDSDAKLRTNESVEPCDQIGMFSHLVLDCENSSVEVAAVLANGGSVGKGASVEMQGGMGTINFQFVRDPDGLWIELAKFPNEEVRTQYAGFPS